VFLSDSRCEFKNTTTTKSVSQKNRVEKFWPLFLLFLTAIGVIADVDAPLLSRGAT
jgi:hypothetical protein